jgi:hypothetical protein
MLVLYGVHDEQALYFVLIVHTVQTLLVVLLGIYGWLRLAFFSIEEGGKRKEEGEYSKHRIVLGMAEGGVDLGDF